ncbi:hypothetical protein SY83_14550 [Paenibacillus swuensis]|uniref:Uncharacterized protein n=1 Tax=Paenibacillus swuensis TaxID=1178515 RepID=A0A172TPF9_9BACL|nr:hypothetical protein SY83_14550 [Paenibacillus swuensis]
MQFNLYHFSEEPNITVFHPRVKANRQDMPPVVWAIDEEHSYSFYVPRNCPRIVYTRTDGLSEETVDKFFGCTSAVRIMTIETRWYSAISNTTLYRYTLPGESFKLFDETAGYYISEQKVTPIVITAMDHLLEKLLEINIEVRFTPSLHPLREAILNSQLEDFGIHRYEYAGR